jgi:riboflavin kinase/FMN adenylyltransferase
MTLMKTYKTLQNLPAEATGTVLAIGNFDGVHRGHQALLAYAKGIADKQGAALSVLSFEPHPRALFRPDDPPFRITSLPVKARRLEDANVDHLFSLNFDWDFASQSAEDFVDRILINGIKPAAIVVGFDFRFGQLRKGTADTIRARGIEVHEFGVVNDTNGEKFSSTVIRQKLRNGDIASANVMLGWDWEIQGAVFRGDRRGHELGYPTANILLGDTLHPAYGIYATLVQIEGEDQWHAAATNIGIRPMFEVKEGQIEAHILDFPDRDIYGRILRVRPVERLRGEAKFNSLETLIDQIEKDCAQARFILIK